MRPSPIPGYALPVLLFLLPQSQGWTQGCVQLRLRPPVLRFKVQTALEKYYRIERSEAHGRGGLLQYYLIGGEECKGRGQRIWFDWTFDRDVTAMQVPKQGKLFAIRFSARGDRATWPCWDHNPFTALYGGGLPIGWRPDGRYYVFPERAGPGQHIPGERDILINISEYDTSGRGGEFSINFQFPSLPNMGGDFAEVLYHFDEAPCGSPLPPPPPIISPPLPACTEPVSCGFCLGSGLRQKWLSVGGESGRLGCPWGPETEAGRSPDGTSGRFTQLRGGDGAYLIWAANGPKARQSFIVEGCIFKLYHSMGGTTSRLGFPLQDAVNVPGGVRQEFEGGFIDWDARTRQCSATFRTRTYV